MGRDICKVVADLKEVMPAINDHRYLDGFIYTLSFRAPELEATSWAELQSWLLARLNVDGKKMPIVIAKGQEWKAEALAIFVGKTTTEMSIEGLFDWRN